jgi:hypothetical protein
MNFPEALKALDQIKPEDVTAELLDQLSEELELAALSARAELIQVCRAQGYTSGEIRDGLQRFDKFIAEASDEAIARLLGRKETRH